MQHDELIQLIIDAFKEVKLEDGIGLSQANAIDDYESQEVQLACRTNDEKENWQMITADHLNKYNSSLSFFDAKGMRFHIPAYMVALLKGNYIMGLPFALTHLSDYTRSQFELLNAKQRAAVRQFLLSLLNDPEYEFEFPAIREALDNYWL